MEIGRARSPFPLDRPEKPFGCPNFYFPQNHWRKLMSADRNEMLAFLQDVAESEHHLRHPEAFAAVVDASGFVLERLPNKFRVSDPDAKPETPAAAPEAVAAG